MADDPNVEQGWIWTFTGRRLDFEKPKPHIVDIAHGLSNICRWTGQCREFYSVAQHSVLVSQALPSSLQLYGLLHDASEAYMNDINKPLKVLAGGDYDEISERLQRAIYMKYGLKPLMGQEKDDIKKADLSVAGAEARDLMGRQSDLDYFKGNRPIDQKIEPFTPAFARRAFLDRFLELM